ncbi:envelope stress response membrane protein PspC [Aliidiomarina sp. Khilg15.8]
MAVNGRKLYRDPQQGKIGGVCAGLADYLGWEVWIIRIIAVTSLVFASSITFVAYCAMWFIIEAKPKASNESVVKETVTTERTADGRKIEVKTRVWEAGETPKEALRDIQQRFDEMESSLRCMESYVTSSEFKVRQEFNRL